MKLITKQIEKSVGAKSNKERNQGDMNSKHVRITDGKLGAIAVAACLAVGMVSVTQAGQIPNVLLNVGYPGNYTPDGRMATNTVNGFATRDSSVVSDNWLTGGGV